MNWSANSWCRSYLALFRLGLALDLFGLERSRTAANRCRWKCHSATPGLTVCSSIRWYLDVFPRPERPCIRGDGGFVAERDRHDSGNRYSFENVFHSGFGG